MIRVHDVRETVQALKVASAIDSARALIRMSEHD
jgi:dihydropteroate synthase